MAFHERALRAAPAFRRGTSTGSSNLAMNEEPLGDFELICESRERRAFTPASSESFVDLARCSLSSTAHAASAM